MTRHLNNVAVTSQNRDQFFSTGVLLIEQLITGSGMDLLARANEEDVVASDHPKEFTSEFDRFSNQFVHRSRRLEKLTHGIRAVMERLVGMECVYTQAMILDLNQGNPGFRWHFDDYSFCFIRSQDMAFSIWIPLIPIDVNKQHGGVIWVAKNQFSAQSRMQQWAFYQLRGRQVYEQGNLYEEARREQFGYRWAGEYDRAMLEDLKRECNMDLGDVFLFDRFTWHRTHELGPGPFPSRPAIVLRVVDADARFDKQLFQKTMELRNHMEAPPSFGHSLEQFEDGVCMRDTTAAGISIWSPPSTANRPAL